MTDYFDPYLLRIYGEKDLRKYFNANIKLVPENFIFSIKASLTLERVAGFPADQECCKRLMDWNVDKFMYIKTIDCPLTIMFNMMKGTYQPSCEVICQDPNVHFQEYDSANKCYPIGKVFKVFASFSNLTANKLLDRDLIDDVLCQIKLKENSQIHDLINEDLCQMIATELKIYDVNGHQNDKLNIVKHVLKKKALNVLVVNMDQLVSKNDLQNFDDHPQLSRGHMELFNNLMDNIKNNFNCNLLTKPSIENSFARWTKNRDNLLKQSSVIVVLISSKIINYLSDPINRNSRQRITSINSESVSRPLPRRQIDPIDRSMKYVKSTWEVICQSQSVHSKIYASFEQNLMQSIYSKISPLGYLLPQQMKEMLCLIAEMGYK